MSTPHSDNRRYILRLWIPALLLCVIVGALLFAALTSGDLRRSVPALTGVTAAALLIVLVRWHQRRRIARMFQAANPEPFLRSFEASLRRMPHGSHFAAAYSATILALYGRLAEADRALESVSWTGVPPLVQAQGAAARAAIAYARGSVAEGLDHAVAATQHASLDLAAPGARMSELAFRTYRNLGLALSGRATDTTAQELHDARSRLPLPGQILAAWGLAMIAKNRGDVAQLQQAQHFIRTQAPHLIAVLKSTGAG